MKVSDKTTPDRSIAGHMEAKKRKRSDDVEADAKKARVGEDNGKVTEPEDDEVEEFFAILRRIRVAVEYFEKGNGEGGRRELTGKRTASRWSPSFRREDFEEVDDVKGPGQLVGDAGLDLNADPDLEQNSS
ncbi:NRR repressor like [Actinidia chinensis var. chinensis]|uniref:NRR repressor like n=1 Tax=Actinidia chinensis var. chinensis TaxID=1590841 RepID=A0A2R6PH28_ACTCC|nr:NRR repressor like [Actinidia chinensis var. chinensis]